MSKKVVKKKTIKKVAKTVKPARPAVKKTAAKASKKLESSGKPGKAAKPSQKTVVKKAIKKIVSKKPTIKKSSKPAAPKSKKVIKKASKPVVKKKVVKKGLAVKVVKKAVKQIKKVLKKSAPKPKIKSKTIAPKKLIKKTSKPIIPVKPAKSLAKPAKKEEKEPLKKALKPASLPEKIKEVKPLNGKSVIPPAKTEKVKPPRRSKKKKKDDDDEPAIENDPLIEEIIRSTKRKPHQPKKPKIIQTFVNPMASLAVAVSPETGKKSAQPKKEPKGKFELEYVVRTSAGILFEFLTSPSGLSEWFADDVNIRDGVFTFFWDGSEQKARLLSFKEDKYVRLQWVDKPEGAYFEFRIEKDELTGDISLIIIDFADEGSDLETSKRLWDSQVNKLLHVIGSY